MGEIGSFMRITPLRIIVWTAAAPFVAAALFFAWYFIVDQFAVPLWLAPSTIQDAVRRVVAEDSGESVLLVDFDVFDNQHINVLTDRRVFALRNLWSAPYFEAPLDAISDAWIVRPEPRYIAIRLRDGEIH